MEKDRLFQFEDYFSRKKRNRTQLFWMKHNPDSEYGWDLQDAQEDVEWMISEIKRLREENSRYKEFIDTLRVQMEQELKGK